MCGDETVAMLRELVTRSSTQGNRNVSGEQFRMRIRESANSQGMSLATLSRASEFECEFAFGGAMGH